MKKNVPFTSDEATQLLELAALQNGERRSKLKTWSRKNHRKYSSAWNKMSTLAKNAGILLDGARNSPAVPSNIKTVTPGVEVNLQIKNASLYQKTDGTLWLKGIVSL